MLRGNKMCDGPEWLLPKWWRRTSLRRQQGTWGGEKSDPTLWRLSAEHSIRRVQSSKSWRQDLAVCLRKQEKPVWLVLHGWECQGLRSNPTYKVMNYPAPISWFQRRHETPGSDSVQQTAHVLWLCHFPCLPHPGGGRHRWARWRLHTRRIWVQLRNIVLQNPLL